MAFDTKEELDDYLKNKPNATCKGIPRRDLLKFIRENRTKYRFLKEADLIGANLSGADLTYAIYNNETTFPGGFKIPGTMIKI